MTTPTAPAVPEVATPPPPPAPSFIDAAAPEQGSETATPAAPAAPAVAAPAEVATTPPAPVTPPVPAEVAKPVEVPPIELKLPDGFVADEAAVKAFKASAADLGLDSGKAQKLFDQYVGLEVSRAKAAEAAFIAQDSKWAAEIAADPEIGGPKQKESVMHARRALKAFGGAAVSQLLAQAGLGNHPTLVRAFVKMGKALAEDSVSGTSSPAGAPAAPSLVDLLYPTMKQSKTKES